MVDCFTQLNPPEYHNVKFELELYKLTVFLIYNLVTMEMRSLDAKLWEL